jgi:signal transduction histidine kinase
MHPSSAPRRALAAQANEWLLGQLTRQLPWSRACSAAFIGALIAAIGVVDYMLGARISLRSCYFIPVALGVIWLGWRPALAAALASTLIWIVGDHYAGASGAQGLPGAWNTVIMICSLTLTIWLLQALGSLQRQMEARVHERTLQLENALLMQGRLRQELMEVSAQERNAIGHEIHDGLCQHLTGAALSAKVHAERLAARGDPAVEEARELIKLIQQGIGQTRSLARGLLMAAIEPAALAGELHELTGIAAAQSETTCRFKLEGVPLAPDPATAAHLYRIAQEAVRNAIFHANAAGVVVTWCESGNDLVLEVADDGCGLPPKDQRRAGLGLNIMAHRAAAMGARFELLSSPGQGTRVICRLAVPPAG